MEHRYESEVVLLNGSNSDAASKKIYSNWLGKYHNSARISSSLTADMKAALVEKFRDEGTLMICTEAGAEGINLQFCSLLINYDLPWNPQRIEQRIGRCHRYGQEFDVVFINFLNQRNQADQRILELLTEKFNLFDGVFGASDSVLGSIENGVDFEKKIQSIYESCRTPEEIEAAFEKLRKELEDEINLKMQKTQEQLLEHFDEDIHDVLKIRLDEAQERLDVCRGNTLPDDLLLLKNRQIDAQLAEVMEQNNALFELERDKQEKWAEDVIYAAEKALRDTKMQIKSLKRDARLAQSIEEQKQNQERLKQLERQQKRQRMEIFDIEDEISDKRDLLISALEERMKQKTEIAELFTIRWKVI